MQARINDDVAFECVPLTMRWVNTVNVFTFYKNNSFSCYQLISIAVVIQFVRDKKKKNELTDIDLQEVICLYH